jgi:hypothetical protein
MRKKAIWLGQQEWEALEQYPAFTPRMPDGTLSLWGLRVVSMENGVSVEM